MLTNVQMITNPKELQIGDVVMEQPYKRGARRYIIEEISHGHAQAVSNKGKRDVKLIPLQSSSPTNWWLITEPALLNKKYEWLSAQ